MGKCGRDIWRVGSAVPRREIEIGGGGKNHPLLAVQVSCMLQGRVGGTRTEKL